MGQDKFAGGYDKRKFVAEYYDLVPAYADRTDRQFYLDLAANSRGPILELGCGTGRLLVPIARAGHSVVGLDFSGSMLARCREKLAREPSDVRARADIVQADMRDFALPDRFDLAIAPFRCFMHLIEVRDQLACLRAVHGHLGTGGTLVLDMFNVDPARTHERKFTEESAEFSGLQLPDGRKLGRSGRIAAFIAPNNTTTSSSSITSSIRTAERNGSSTNFRCDIFTATRSSICWRGAALQSSGSLAITMGQRSTTRRRR